MKKNDEAYNRSVQQTKADTKSEAQLFYKKKCIADPCTTNREARGRVKIM